MYLAENSYNNDELGKQKLRGNIYYHPRRFFFVKYRKYLSDVPAFCDVLSH